MPERGNIKNSSLVIHRIDVIAIIDWTLGRWQMNSIIWWVGFIVILLAVLGFLGLR